MLVLLLILAAIVVAAAVALVLAPMDVGPRWSRSPVGRGVALVVLAVCIVGLVWQYAGARVLFGRARISHPEAVAFPAGATRQLAELLAAWLGQRPSSFGRQPVVVAVAGGLEVWWRYPDRPELSIPWRGMTAYATGTSVLTGKRGNWIVLGIPGVPVPVELLVGARKAQALRLWHAVTAGVDAAALREEQHRWGGIR